MDSLNQTALMKLENHAVDINEYSGLLEHSYLFYLLANISYFALEDPRKYKIAKNLNPIFLTLTLSNKIIFYSSINYYPGYYQ